MTNNELREQVNSRLIEALSNNVLPWRRPWSSGVSGRHRNFANQRPYGGVNPMLLELHALKHGLTSNQWGTYRQWESAGCSVMRRPADVPAGQWGCAIVFAKPVTKRVIDKDTGDETDSSFFVLRSFVVFSSDQVTGEAAEKLKASPTVPTENAGTYPAVEELIGATKAKIITGSSAFYALPQPECSWPNHKSGDYITMPDRKLFVSPEAYLSTALHELAHWSEVRVGWDRRKHGYAMGELVAEICSCQVAAELGMPIALEQHAAYLKSWLAGMKESASFAFKACGMANKTTDFLLGIVRPADAGAGDETEETSLAGAA